MSSQNEAHGDEDEGQKIIGIESKKYHDSNLGINITWDYDRQEFIATFDSYDGAPDGDSTWGAGDTKREAVINLLENCRDWELEN